MLNLIGRVIGTAVVLTLSAVGAHTVLGHLQRWKAAYDRTKNNNAVKPV